MDGWWAQIGLTALGGSCGAVSRLLVGRLLYSAAFPWATVAINLAGCLALGLLIGATSADVASHRTLRTLIGTGFLGAFTTFSTFGVEAIALAEKERYLAAGLYVGSQVVLGLTLAFVGVVVGKWLRESM